MFEIKMAAGNGFSRLQNGVLLLDDFFFVVL